MRGWKLWVTIFALFLGLLLSTLETTIVSTALITIASDLGGYDKSNWIIVAYLLTYTGFLIVYSRCSDIFGRKSSFITALAIFTAFSIACGVSRTMEQLIIFRAFQGIGGAGIYSMVMAVMAEVTPVESIGPVTGLMSTIFALSSILGPVLGGAITTNASWRWVFYLNIPGGGLALAIVIWFFPRNDGRLPINRLSFNRIDWPGILLSLIGSVFLLLALEEGGSAFSWDGSLIVVSFIVTGAAWIAFIAWEIYVAMVYSRRTSSFASKMMPVFPIWLIRRRIVCASLIAAFLAGFPFMVLIVYLPERFEIQDGLSPVASGIRMLPLLLLSALGAGAGGVINSRKNISFYTLMVGLSLQLIGLGCMTTLPTTGTIIDAQYGYQVLLGLGFGTTLTSLVVISRLEVDAPDLAITMGAVTQVRVLGGTIGISIGQVLITHFVDRDLSDVLSTDEMAALKASVSSSRNFPASKQNAVSEVYGRAFNAQIKVVLYITAACWVLGLGTFKKNPVNFRDAGRIEPCGSGDQEQDQG
ncbi:putative MFS multidrug transporter [Aspergillus vadensis CBS 113365]|uniref:MFS multidrug transporter n=1 Tax=Aspergillus vadensis (strain CBS 113365 / IMI 142717 / IBT 24658) TaxID=1448311 RepID=A0A319BB01_ASPVC|nr:putative MFS multidrug transporter [Aspergillus vadensis CBS 113365]PYH67690.1 putative MFS multidrug transporter [Aspergillus vadensis CBS 113365]